MTTPQQLHKALVDYFSLGELRTLSFELEIPYENLGGDGKDGKALALVQHAQRHGLFDAVVTYTQNARPHIDFGATTAVSPTTSPTNPPNEAKSSPTYNFYGPVSGSAIGESSLQAENIAGGDITIHNYAEPQNRGEFADQLTQLEALLKQAVANGEIADKRDAETAVEDIQDAIAEVKDEQPRASRIGRRLEDVKEILDKAGGVAGAAKKAGTAVLKAIPIISGLIKAAAALF